MTRHFPLLIGMVGVLAISGCGAEFHETPPGEDRVVDGQHSFVPAGGYVPTPEVAIAIAEAVLIPIYGEERIRNQRPLVAQIVDDVWMIRGTLPRDHLGGVAELELERSDGRILRVSHGQ